MNKHDVESRADLVQIVASFYAAMLKDPIVGFIFTDIAKIDMETHLPIIVDFWSDIVLRSKAKDKQGEGENAFNEKRYRGNALRKHVELSEKLTLKPGHFTRWLYLFTRAVQANHQGKNADLMIVRAEQVAQSISAAISDRKKNDMRLVLPKT